MATNQHTIRIEGGGPYGFRLFGGDGDPLVVAKLRKRSKASDAGLEEGDVLLSITDHSCRNMSHVAAMDLVDNVGHYLELKVNRKDGFGPSDSLRVTKTEFRTRSLTPTYNQTKNSPSPVSPSAALSHSPSLQWSASTAKNYPSPTPFTASVSQPSPVQWKAPTVKNTPSPASVSSIAKWSPKANDPTDHLGSFGQTQEILFHLHGSSVQQGGPDRPWTTTAVSGLSPGRNDLSVDEHSGSPSQKRRYSPAPTAQPKPAFQASSPFQASPTPALPPITNRTPTVWKPSWQTPTESSTDKTFPVLNTNSKENAPPVTNRSAITHTFQVSNAPASSGQKPDVWKPSIIPVVNKAPPPPPQPVTPLKEFNFENDLINGLGPVADRGQSSWADSTVDTVGKRFNLPSNLDKILTASQTNEDEYDALIESKGKKKVFVDSSFYDDPGHKYPTVFEQIKMARQVALMLTAPSNASARGHRMFMKRKEKADKWVVESAEKERNVRGYDKEPEPYYNPTPWSTAAPTWKAPSITGRVGEIPAPPPLPTSKLFAPRLNPEDQTSDRVKALSADEFERLRLYSQKTTHNTLSPQLCFNLAKDLRQSKGRGGRMFAKRRAKAEEWTIEGPNVPNPKVLQKLSGGFTPSREAQEAPPPTTTTTKIDRPDNFDDFAPVNRLQEMIELAKPKMTPWDAVAEFGNVDMAFEHLQGISFLKPKPDSYVDSVASSLQQATKRKSSTNPTPAKANLGPRPAQTNPWNRTTETAKSNWAPKTSPSHAFDFSPSPSFGVAPGYRPVNLPSFTQVGSFSGGGYTDL